MCSDRDIAVITWLRDQTRAGVTISQAVELFKSRDHPDRGTTAPKPSNSVPDDAPARNDHNGFSRYAHQLADALVAYDARSGSRLVEEALAIVPIEDVCRNILQSALEEIGHRWQRSEILVSGEHFATSFASRALGSLYNLSRPEEGRGPIVATCLEGELHETCLLMTSLFLSRRGFRVVYLGSNFPAGDLVQTIEELRPRLCWCLHPLRRRQ